MHKKSTAIIALSIALLLPAESYAKSSPTPKGAGKTAPANTAADTSPQIIDKLQVQIIVWQDEIIRGMEAQVIVPSIYREMASAGVDTETGQVKDQKILDLLGKYGIGIKTKDGKQLNTQSSGAIESAQLPETLPLIKVSDNATDDEKARIIALMQKGQTLIARVTEAKKMILRLKKAANDLSELSKTDEQAKALLKKFEIKQPGAASSTSPAPSAAPSPSAASVSSATPAPSATPVPSVAPAP